MNRKERRAHEIAARKASMSLVTAIHEAGHAIAHLLTSKLLDQAPEHAVSSIELATGKSFRSLDGMTTLTPVAECQAPLVSARFQAAVEQVLDIRKADQRQLWNAFCIAGTIDERRLNMWCRMLQSAMGGAAEAKFKGLQDPYPLFLSHTCEEDLEDIWNDCRVIDVIGAEQVAMRNIFLFHAWTLVSRQSVWSAISAVARHLKNSKQSIPGARVAELVWPLLLRS